MPVLAFVQSSKTPGGARLNTLGNCRRLLSTIPPIINGNKSERNHQ